jgi:predicted alpha-1,6-mannanase (GH76 family)
MLAISTQVALLAALIQSSVAVPHRAHQQQIFGAINGSLDSTDSHIKAVKSSLIPSTWVNTSVPAHMNLADLSTIANKAAITTWSFKDEHHVFGNVSFGWHAANVYTAIAYNDMLVQPSQSSMHRDQILEALPKLYDSVPFLDKFNDDAVWWALASLDAAEAYSPGNKTLINLAQRVFDDIYEKSQVKDSWYEKTPEWKPITINPKCRLTGGVVWKDIPEWAGVPSISTTLHARLGARLYMLTNETRYLDSAIAADKYIKKYTMTPEGIVVDGYNLTSCELDRAPYK